MIESVAAQLQWAIKSSCMAKKKNATPGPVSTSSTGSNRRRAAARTAPSANQDAMSSSVSPLTDEGSSARTVDTAADMARAQDLASAPSDTSSSRYSPEETQSYNPAAHETPTYDQIAEAAYHRYLRRGAEDGRDFDDWVEAERELKSR
jgi:hypothetical protein